MARVSRRKSEQKKRDIIHEDIDMDLHIDEDHINEELMDQPLLYRKYAKMKVEVNDRLRLIKQKLKEAESSAYLNAFNENKKMTVKNAESIVNIDSTVKELRDELREAEKLSEDYDGIMRAIYQRHEALKEVSANIRHELD